MDLILCNYKSKVILNFLMHILTFPGSEAMFADLGHFSQLSIKVYRFIFVTLTSCPLTALSMMNLCEC